MKSLLAFPIFAFAILLVPSYAQETDYLLSANGYKISNDAVSSMTLDFQLEMISPVNPVLRQGTLVLDGKELTIENFNFILYRDGKLFMLNAESDDFTIRANGLILASNQGGSIYHLKGVITRDGVPERFLLVAILKPIEEQKTIDSEIELPDEDSIPEKEFTTTVSKTDLIVVTKQDYRNYWNENYDIYVKVFDKKLNPTPNFDDFYGTIGGATVNVTLSHSDGSAIQKISGVTDKNGFWHGEQYFPENISKPGKYLVNVIVSFLSGTTEKKQDMFLFGITQNQIAQGNSTAP